MTTTFEPGQDVEDRIGGTTWRFLRYSGPGRMLIDDGAYGDSGSFEVATADYGPTGCCDLIDY